MKKKAKQISLILFVVFSLMGCGSKSTDGEKVQDNSEKIKKIQIQFQNEYVECTDTEEIAYIENIFHKDNLKVKKNEDKKGWIYKFVLYSEKDEVVKEAVIINENEVKIEDKCYTCESIDLTKLDEITGIDRN